MRLCLRYLRLCLFASGLLLGLQIPGFVEQYGSRLEARALESKQSLGGFQSDADKYFDGDLNRLIAHYKRNKDQIVRDGGANIERLVTRYQKLNQALLHYSKNAITPYTHTFLQPIEEVRDNTLKRYDFMVLLNAESLVFGLSLALLIVLLSDLLWTLLRRLLRPLRRSNRLGELNNYETKR